MFNLLIVMYVPFCIFCISLVCKCVLNYCHRVSTQLRLNIYHIISRHVTSRRVTSRRVTSRRVTSRRVTSRHVTSRHIISYHIVSYTISYIIISYHILYYILLYHIIYIYINNYSYVIYFCNGVSEFVQMGLILYVSLRIQFPKS
jgi:hypothetical protein